MEIQAQLNYLRISPRKVRLVCDMIKGLNYNVAKDQLNYLTKRSAYPIAKLIDSAVASATNNYDLVKNNLYIKDIRVDAGPILKRHKPKGFGSAMPIAKRTSRVTLVLDERVSGMRGGKVQQVQETSEGGRQKEDIVKEDNKFDVKKEVGTKKSGGFVKKLFRRKAMQG